jgi:hypothetical protein
MRSISPLAKFVLISLHDMFGNFVSHIDHRDAFVHRTHQRAQIAADAIVDFDLRNLFAGQATRAEARDRSG